MRLNSLSFLSKMTIFVLLLSTIPVIFIGVFSYITSSQEIQRNVNNSKMQLIMQINSNLEQKLVTVNHTLNQVVSSTVLKKALQSPLYVTDFKTYNDIRSEVRNMQSFETKLDDVVLINFEQNWMIKNSGLYRFEDYPLAEEIKHLINLEGNSAWTLTPTTWFYSEENSNGANCKYNISLVKKLPTTGIDKSGLAIANIPSCELQDFIQKDGESTEEIIILDQHKRMLFHSNQDLIGQPLVESGLSTERMMVDSAGQFTTKLSGQDYAVSYFRSELNDWTYLSATSIKSLTQKSSQIGTYTLILCLILLFISALIALFGSRRMYSPIRRLLKDLGIRPHRNEFEHIGAEVSDLFQSKSRLEKEVHQHVQQVRTFYLTKVYVGNFKSNELLQKFEQYGYGKQVSEWRTMAVLTLQIDFTKQTRYEKKDLELLLFAVQNMLEELIAHEERLTPVIIDSTVVLLVGSPETDPSLFTAYLYSLTEEAQQHIGQVLDLSVSIGISLPVDSFHRIPIAYREGLEALRHRIKLGKGIVIQYQDINNGKHYVNLSYPAQLENELIEAIKLGDERKAGDVLDQLLGSIFDLELLPHEYQIPLTRLLNNLLLVMQESGISIHQIYHEKRSVFEDILRLHTVDEIRGWYWSKLIVPVMVVFRDRQDTQYHHISEKIIDLVQNYYDTDLTLEECASRLHYNANYLSSVFRKETGCSFSEYLTTYRFNMAKKWLTTTDMSIKDIATKLRYNNSQNFIRSFRKIEGITPGQYREQRKAM
ncbi:helix-turn-helix domain-containing protein [Neobacillus mesonae]|nr:helix-turn-helix domain-containing protein [Neobacillus mesonae]